MIPFHTERASSALVAFMAVCALVDLNLFRSREVENAKTTSSIALFNMR